MDHLFTGGLFGQVFLRGGGAGSRRPLLPNQHGIGLSLLFHSSSEFGGLFTNIGHRFSRASGGGGFAWINQHGESVTGPKESLAPELQPEQLSPVLVQLFVVLPAHPTPSMVASSHQVTLLLRLWDISSGTQILCTMRDLEHSVLFQKP